MILDFNAGSSSVKYELVDLKADTRPIRGLVELDGSLTHRVEGRPPYTREGPFADHEAAFGAALELLAEVRPAAIGRRAGLGDPDAVLARQVYCHRIRKYVGAYYALLGHVDAIVFTGGVGEHDAGIRAGSLTGLERLGIHLDPGHNAAHRETVSDSEVRVLIIPADEEWEIAHQTATLTGQA